MEKVMTKKKKRGCGLHFKANTQSIIGDIDYYNKLNDDEKQWLNDFNDGTLGNNCRKYSLFTDREDYTEMSRKIYRETNARNYDLYSDMEVRKRLESLDHLAGEKEERYISKLLFKQMTKKEREQLMITLGVQDFETSVNNLVCHTMDRLNADKANPIYPLLRFYTMLNTIVKEEIKFQRQEKNLKKNEKKSKKSLTKN